jgi:hypothetical protein
MTADGHATPKLLQQTMDRLLRNADVSSNFGERPAASAQACNTATMGYVRSASASHTMNPCHSNQALSKVAGIAKDCND